MAADRHVSEALLRIALVPGLGEGHLRALLAAFGSAEAVLAAPDAALAPYLSAKLREGWARGADAALLEKTLAWLIQPGRFLLTLADADYPPMLREISDPPPLLYGVGRRELLGNACLGVVGSRQATPQGEQNAEAFAEVLAQAGFTVVSGLALGIDGAAHRGALRGTGSTIAVVGTGLNLVYPARHKALAHRIAEEGLMLSSFALDTPSAAGHFPSRNRIISGLSRGVLVVEAALSSGSLITARQALEQGREVFAVPGSIHSPHSKGCHALIKQGAKLVESAADILEELAWPVMPPLPAAGEATDADPVLQALGFDPLDLETLAGRLGLTVEVLSVKLLALELEGAVARLPGGRYQRLG